MAYREAVGVEAGCEFVEVDGVRLALARSGQGPVVVCLHAIGHGGGDYAGFAAAIGSRHQVVRLDWPGQGRSGVDHQTASAARYAELLSGVLAQLGLTRPLLVGNSIGGAAALIHAQRHPVRALVLCDPAGLVPVSAPIRGFCRLMARFFAAGSRGAGWFGRAFAAYYRWLVLPAPAAAAQRERIIRSASEIAGVLAQAWHSFSQPEADLRAAAAALDVPIWLAWARGDRVIPLRACQPAIRRLQQARLTTYAGGHAAFLEQPEAFQRDFLAFVSALP